MLTLQDILPGISSPNAKKMPDTASDIEQLRSLSFNDLIGDLSHSLVKFAINLVIAVAVFYIGRFIIRKIYRVISTIFIRRQIDRSLATFILSLVNIVLYFILVVTVIGILGIETTSFLALFASAGVAIGMALSGTLQNFAGGVLILLLKPYKIGDYIEVQGYAGTVREIQIFSTIITTSDNKSISIPNGSLSTGSVNNWSREAYRRVSWTVSISYGDDVSAIRKAILEMFANDERIEPAKGTTATGDAQSELQDKPVTDTPTEQEPEQKRTLLDRLLHRHHKTKRAISQWEEKREAELIALLPKPDYSPAVVVNELAASSVDLQVRAWTKTANYWSVFYDYNERFYNELPHYGANFPFPQLDVHLPKQ